MDMPIFMTVEVCDQGELTIPVALAWTTNDGLYKAIQIKPEDEWIEELSLSEYDSDELTDFGQTASDVIKELVADIDKASVACFDPHWMDQALTCLFDAYDQKHSFHLQGLPQTFGVDYPTFEENVQAINDEFHFQMDNSEDQIQLLIEMWRRK